MHDDDHDQHDKCDDDEREFGLGQAACGEVLLRVLGPCGEAGEFLIGFGDGRADANLSLSGDLVEAASRLFDLLHQADASAFAKIAVAPVPNEGLGFAINDRLRRAAHPARRQA